MHAAGSEQLALKRKQIGQFDGRQSLAPIGMNRADHDALTARLT